MGLDILLYDAENKKIGIHEFDEELHHWIFQVYSLPKEEFVQILEVSDYYKTNATFSGRNLGDLVMELKSLFNENSPKRSELKAIIDLISGIQVHKIRITGD